MSRGDRLFLGSGSAHAPIHFSLVSIPVIALAPSLLYESPPSPLPLRVIAPQYSKYSRFTEQHAPLLNLTTEEFGSIIKVNLKTCPMYFMVCMNNDGVIPHQT